MKKQPAKNYTNCKICNAALQEKEHRIGVCKNHVNEALTFKTYLSILDEDLSSDITKLQGHISTIDTQITQRTNNLVQQKQRLQKMLAVKQQQKEVEDRRLQAKAKSETKPPLQPTQDIQRGQ